MNTITKMSVGLFLAASLAGCASTPGQPDYGLEMMYGKGAHVVLDALPAAAAVADTVQPVEPAKIKPPAVKPKPKPKAKAKQVSAIQPMKLKAHQPEPTVVTSAGALKPVAEAPPMPVPAYVGPEDNQAVQVMAVSPDEPDCDQEMVVGCVVREIKPYAVKRP
jgi:hypothetical protein